MRNKKGQFIIGNIHSEEVKRKISMSKKGKQSTFKGKKHTKEAKEKNRLAHIGKKPNNALEIWRRNGGISWNKGLSIHLSPQSEFKKGDMKGEKNVNWRGGITPINEKIRQSIEYKQWRMKIFQRNRFTCVNCGYRSNKRKDIRADHIKPFSLYPELRFDLNNGRTLCIDCDLKIGWNSLRERNAEINYWKMKSI